MSSPLETVNNYFTALSEGRVADALAAFSEDITWHQPGANRFSGVHSGPSQVGQILGQMVEHTDGTFVVEPTGPAMVNGDVVAVPLQFRGVKKSQTLDQPGIDVFVVRDGAIAEVFLFSSDTDAEDAFWG